MYINVFSCSYLSQLCYAGSKVPVHNPGGNWPSPQLPLSASCLYSWTSLLWGWCHTGVCAVYLDDDWLNISFREDADDAFLSCRTEECDDSNLLDGDGCSKKCHKEIGFNCLGVYTNHSTAKKPPKQNIYTVFNTKHILSSSFFQRNSSHPTMSHIKITNLCHTY